jgi:hypothetical protein
LLCGGEFVFSNYIPIISREVGKQSYAAYASENDIVIVDYNVDFVFYSL